MQLLRVKGFQSQLFATVVAVLTTAFALVACGGGGGGGSTPAPTPNTVTVTCPNGSSQTAASTSLANAQCPAPQMTSISPGNASTTVLVDTFAGVDVVTDSTLDPTSITSANVTLKAGTTVVAGTVSTVSTKGFRFTPTSKLAYAQAYDFAATVKDTLGKTLTVSITFTTLRISSLPGATTEPVVWPNVVPNWRTVSEGHMQFVGLAHGNGTWVAAQSDGGVWTSTDLKAWTRRIWGSGELNLPGSYVSGLTFHKGKFYLSGMVTLPGLVRRVILATSTDGQSWSIAYEGTVSTANEVVKSVGDRVFLYGYYGALQSSDGSYWSVEATNFGGSRITDVSGSPDKYVALVTDGKVTNVSTRGTAGSTWSEQTLVAPAVLWGIAYGNGMWVAVGAGGSVYVSSDTKVWQSRDLKTTATQGGVDFVNGRFFVHDNAGPVRASVDGVTWELLSVPGIGSDYHGVVWNGTTLAIARDDGVAFSTDNLTWSMPPFTTLYGYGVAFGKGRFVMCGSTPSPAGNIFGIYQSTDGEHWSKTDAGPIVKPCIDSQVEHFDAGFIVNNLYSADGLTWSALPFPPGSGMKIVKVGTTYVAYYDYYGGGSGIRTSTDLLTWQAASGEVFVPDLITNLPSGQLLKFVIIYTGSQGLPVLNLLTSSDGLSWSFLTASPLWMQQRDGAATGNGLLTLVGNGGDVVNTPLFWIATTTDGLKWTIQTDGVPRTARPTTIVFSGSDWVAAGVYGTILRSTNAVTWVSESAGSGKWFYKGAYGNGRYVLTTADGGIVVK